MCALSASPSTRFPVWHRIVVIAALLIAAPSIHAQMLDLNGNGVSDVWELVYGAEISNPDQDSDEDGVSDRLEAIAGTNPYDARSVPRIASFVVKTNGVRATMEGALGKRYDLQATEVLCGSDSTNWFSVASLIARTNTLITLAAEATRPAMFFRVLVSDVDTDGDGVNDWEEYQLGLDPFSPASSGQKDAEGNPLPDRLYAANWLQVVSGKRESHFDLVTSGGMVRPSLALYASTLAAGTGLTAQYFTNSSTTYSSPLNFNPTNLFLTTNDPVISFVWGPALTPNLSNTFSTVRWTGQVEPQYSETYLFETRTDDGVKLYVNDQLVIDHWQLQSKTSWTGAIDLQAGVRYNIRMDYFNRGGGAQAQLYWSSPSQPRQIIPSVRLYPSSDGLAPGGVTSPLNAISFLGQPFTYTITGANTPLSYDATNLPPGLICNTSNGVISGIPMLAGTFEVTLSVSNIVGIGQAVLELQVIDTGSSVTREIWSGVGGTSVTNIPVNVPAMLTNTLGTLEGIANFGDNYGERIRGYLTAPVTGNYYFWLAANSSAELWISNDDEPANKVRRVTVTKPTAPRQWNLQASQRSPWLALEAGKRYYLEILHKAGQGAGDHWSVGWLQDNTGTNTVPTDIVPGFVLSSFTNTPSTQLPGTLYSANLVAQAGAISSGVGSATLRVSADGTQAVLRYSHSALSSPVTAKHIHADTYLGKNAQGQIIFDIDAATPEVDGSYVWNITASGPLTAADIIELIKEGKSYLNVHTVNYPGGEINGHFGLAAGTPTFTPPPPAPVWTDDHSNSNAAARFLRQATFGPSRAQITSVKSLGYSKWIDNQFALPVTTHLPNVLAANGSDPNGFYPGTLTFNTWWQRSVTAPDQLRQRVAFALSEIMVVSENGVLGNNGRALSAYYDILLKDSFGNFRTLLEDVTLSPAMGIYLDMRRNDKANTILGTHPNENYAREILQLFSIGLNRTWPDGALVLNSKGDLVPTYDQDVILGYARVFTGWNYWQTNQANKRLPNNWNPSPDYIKPMVLVPVHHELGTKGLLDNVVLPAAQGPQADTASTNFDSYCSQDLEKGLDLIFNNQNVGPFICRQLIQRLVTSHPSRDYIYRVVQKFNDNGAGVRGDMKAVIKAILLDYEARGTNVLAQPTYGKQREPLLRATAVARAFPAPAAQGATWKQSGGPLITVTTGKPHRLSSSDDVFIKFTGTTAPTSQTYNNVGVTGPRTFTINAQGLAAGSYAQSGTTITVVSSGNGLSVGNQIFLTFTSGGAPNGVYTVASILSPSTFTVNATGSATRTGNCLFPKWTDGGFDQSGSNIVFTTSGPHGLKVGNNVYVIFDGGSPSPDGVYKVASVSGATRFTVRSSVGADTEGGYSMLLPLAAPPITRSGSATVRFSTWEMDYTDSGNGSTLSQTPLDSPSVFNFFFPDYKFQGILASAGLTTPEFQLTSDTSIVLQMNFISGGVLSAGSNTNGLSSFTSGNGAIMLDLGSWMTPANTSDAAIPGLVESLNSLLCAGQLSPAVKPIIINYVANTNRFPYSSPTPTRTQMRDRVRAVVHQIVSSPDFAVQR